MYVFPTVRGFGINLNLFTALIGSIIVGLGIDFGIHMTERIREGGTTIQAVRNAISTSGMSFTEATITMLAGLATVFTIPIPSIWEFITMIDILLILSVLAALFLLPAVYIVIIGAEAPERIAAPAAAQHAAESARSSMGSEG
jgi:hypothetical protein